MGWGQARLDGGRINRDLLTLTQMFRSLEQGGYAPPSTRSSKLVRALERGLRKGKKVRPSRPPFPEKAGERSEIGQNDR